MTQIPSATEGNGQKAKRKRGEDPIQEQLTRLESRLDDIKETSQLKIEELTNQILELQKAGPVESSKEEKLKKENHDLKAQLARKDQELFKEKKRKKEYKVACHSLDKKLESSYLLNECLNNDIEEKKEIIHDYQYTIEVLDSRSNDQQHAIHYYEEKIDNQEILLEEKRKIIANQQDEILDFQKTIDNQKITIEEDTKIIADCKQQIKDLEEDLDEFESDEDDDHNTDQGTPISSIKDEDKFQE